MAICGGHMSVRLKGAIPLGNDPPVASMWYVGAQIGYAAKLNYCFRLQLKLENL